MLPLHDRGALTVVVFYAGPDCRAARPRMLAALDPAIVGGDAGLPGAAGPARNPQPPRETGHLPGGS
jgi:hypothetical protein